MSTHIEFGTLDMFNFEVVLDGRIHKYELIRLA